MNYKGLKRKILNLEKAVSIYEDYRDKYRTLEFKNIYAGSWLNCYMDLQALRNRIILDADKDILYKKLIEIRKKLGIMR